MIRVVIEREIAEGLEQFYENAIAKLLDVMITAAGYVSGESLVDIHRPNRYIVITRWVSEEAWNRWCASAERQQMLVAIGPFMQSEEKFTLLKQLSFHHEASAA